MTSGYGTQSKSRRLKNICSKTLGGSKVDIAFHSSDIDEMSSRNSWGHCVVKSKLSPCIGYAVGAIKIFFLNNGNNHYLKTSINDYLKKHDTCFVYTVDL